jgi:hypothetical protein
MSKTEGTGKPRRKVSNRVLDLRRQADRARKLASESISPLVAELYEIHALECERSAAKRSDPDRKKALT